MPDPMPVWMFAALLGLFMAGLFVFAFCVYQVVMILGAMYYRRKEHSD